jgi:hypothetical protein
VAGAFDGDNVFFCFPVRTAVDLFLVHRNMRNYIRLVGKYIYRVSG